MGLHQDPKMIWARSKFEVLLNPLIKFHAGKKKLNSLNRYHLLLWVKKFGIGKICQSIFGLAEKVWNSPKYFETYRRTRQKSSAPLGSPFYAWSCGRAKKKSVNFLTRDLVFCPHTIKNMRPM